MLPRNVQSLPIVFSKGLDTKTDTRALPPPSLALLQNVVFDRPGVLAKRLGTATLGTGGPTTGARVLARFEDQLLQLGGDRLYSRGASAWRDIASLPALSAKSQVIAQGAQSLSGGDCATSGTVTVYAWRSSLDGHVYARAVDQSSGSVVVADTKLSGTASLSTEPVQVVAMSTYLVVFYVTGGAIKARSLSTSGLSWSAEASPAGFGTVRAFAAAPGVGATSYIHLVTRDSGGGQLKLGGISPSALTVSPAVVTFGTAYGTAAGVLAVCQQGTRVCVLAEEYASELHTWVRLASDYSAVANSSNGGISSSIVKNGALCASSVAGGWLCWVTVVPTATATNPATHYIQTLYVKTDSTQNNTATVLRGCSVASQGLAIASTDTGYCWIRKWTLHQSAYLLVDQAGALAARVASGRATPLPTAAAPQGLPHISSAGGTVNQCLLQTLETSAAGQDAGAICRTQIDTGFRPRGAALRQGFFIPGGLPRVYTGSQLVEAGFLEWPEPGTDAGQITIGPATAWVNNTAYVLGNRRRPTVQNGFLYECTTAGTSAFVTEPTWPTRLGATVTDNTVTWTCIAYSLASANTSTSYAVGAMVAPFGGNGYWYLCTTAGASGGSAPTWPTLTGATVTDGSVVWRCMGSLSANPAQADGTRTYKAVYEWQDERGGPWRSAPSSTFQVDIAGYSGAGAALISVRTLQLTSKVGVRIVIYRADSTGSFVEVLNVPNDSTVAELRIVDAIGETPAAWDVSTAYASGDRAAPSVLVGLEAFCTTAGKSGGVEPAWPTTIGATVTDGSVTWTMQASTANTPAIYTEGGELPSGPPPACTLAAAFSGRLAIGGLESDGQTVQLSKSADVAFPAFDLLGLLSYPAGAQGGDLTALAVFDGHLFCFKRTAVNVIDGTPPDDSGFGGSMSPPVALPLDVGALDQHGVVADDQGVYHCSVRGIYRLTRGTSSEYVGAPMETLGGTVTGAAVMTAENEVRFATSVGVYVYNSLLGAWCLHTGFGTPLDVACFADLAVYAPSGSAALTEVVGSYGDSGTAVLMRLKTGQLAPGGPNAWCRFSRVVLTAQEMDSTTWNFITTRDGMSTVDQSYSITVDSSDTSDGEDTSDATVRMDCLPGRARSLEVELQETTSAPSQGLRLFSMTILWAPWSVEQKVPAAQQKG